MKITAIRTQAIEIPFKEPIGTSIHNITGVALVAGNRRVPLPAARIIPFLNLI